MPQMDLKRVRNEMAKRGLNGLIATTPANLFYTTGFLPPFLDGRVSA